jgi:ribonuclease HI
MITMTADGGANPNPGSAGWGVLIRQNRKFLCLSKHYSRASNNMKELSTVIVGLYYLPPEMIIWRSTDSQYVQIAQAIHKQETESICLKGHCKGDKNEEAVCQFQRDHVGLSSGRQSKNSSR